MASFTTATDNLKTTLQQNAALLAFVTANFPRPLTVVKAFKNRQELNAADFPIIMITRPKVKKNYATYGVKDGLHTVLLFLGFHCDDKEQAQDLVVKFEELVDDAILADHTLGATVTDALPDESENDNGFYHPFYFIGMTVEISHRR